MQGALAEMPSNICIPHLAKIIYHTAIVIHPLILSPIPQNGIAKKVILPPKKYDLFSILDSS